MTRKYYDEDAYQTEFDATVLSCEPYKGHYAVLLDGTLFFPEEGGQKADKGFLGEAQVLDVQIREDDILHIVSFPLTVGASVHGKIDFSDRYHKMQNHSGEHIVSGLVHRLYGLENVGFHLGSEDVTLDFNGELSREDLNEIEDLANGIVYQNLPILAEYPSADKLCALEYRSKLSLTENVRIVTIPGVDVCACCAPHVKETGEIGVIKLLDFIRYKGGVRIHMQCGRAALLDYRKKYTSVAKSSALMSVKQDEVAEGVANLLKTNELLSFELRTLKKRLAKEMASQVPDFSSHLCRFVEEFDMDFWREVASQIIQKKTGTAIFLMEKEPGVFSYVACSSTANLKQCAQEMNASLCGKGGGKADMIQGTLRASKEEILLFLNNHLTI